MMLLLVAFLQNRYQISVPTAFTYFSTRMILAAATALILSIFLGPRFIKKLYELKIGQPIRSLEECPLLAELHGKKKDTPTMGGILILFSMAASLLLWMDLQNVFTIILLLTTVVLGCLGAADDYLKLRFKNSKGLKAKKKMAIQLFFSGFIALYLLAPPFTNSLGFRPPSAKEQITEGKRIVATTLTTAEYVERFYIPFFKDPVFVFDGALRIVS